MAKSAQQLRDEARERMRVYRMENREKCVARQKAWRLKNADKAKAAIKAWEAKNKEKSRANRLRWESDNKERVKAYKDNWHKNNRDKCRKSAREYVARRRETDANFKIRYALRSRIWSALKAQGVSKSKTTVALVGCDIPFLRAFLEVQFKPGMSWANYGKWHVDHRAPCAEFDLRDPAQQKLCFNYKNLQPLWGPENIRKGANLAVHQAT